MTDTITRTATIAGNIEITATLDREKLTITGHGDCPNPEHPRHEIMTREFENPTGELGDLQLVVLDTELLVTLDGEDIAQVLFAQLTPEGMGGLPSPLIFGMLVETLSSLDRGQRDALRIMLDALDEMELDADDS